MSNQFPRHQSQDISKNSKTNPRDVVVTYHRLNYIALHYWGTVSGAFEMCSEKFSEQKLPTAWYLNP